MITTGSSSGPSCTCGGLQASKFVPKLNKDQSGDGDVELNLMTMMMTMTMSLHFGIVCLYIAVPVSLLLEG